MDSRAVGTAKKVLTINISLAFDRPVHTAPPRTPIVGFARLPCPDSVYNVPRLLVGEMLKRFYDFVTLADIDFLGGSRAATLYPLGASLGNRGDRSANSRDLYLGGVRL